MAGKKPHLVDQHVGSRVRLRRMLLGMSQERNPRETSELTFQQVQKYEKGVNRIGASRLLQISKILDVPATILLRGSTARRRAQSAGMAEADFVVFILEIPQQPRGSRAAPRLRQDRRSEASQERGQSRSASIATSDNP